MELWSGATEGVGQGSHLSCAVLLRERSGSGKIPLLWPAILDGAAHFATLTGSGFWVHLVTDVLFGGVDWHRSWLSN